jgi:hypothetical protein
VKFTTSKGEDFQLNSQANIISININSAHEQDFAHMSVLNMIAANFDISGEDY